MATPTLGALNLTEISTAESTTNWTMTSIALDNELFKEGSNAVYGVLRTDLETAYYDDGTARSGSGEHLRLWINFTAYTFLDTEANGGMEVFVYDNTNTDYYTIFGGDTYAGGWFNMVVDMAKFTTVTQANVDRWGVRFNRTAAPRNVDNTWIDYIRYMDGYYATGGTSGDKIDLAGIAAQDASTTNAYGIILESEGIFFGYGQLQIGNGATTTWFEMDGDVLSFADQPVAANFYEVSGNGSGADIVFSDSLIQSAGTTDDPRFVFDMSDTNITLSITGCVLQRGAAITFATGQTVTGNTFNDCGQITHGGADMSECVVKNYAGTPDAAVLYNVNADPDGEMDNMSFTKGSATKHAIEFGTSIPSEITLRGIDFSGYNASNNQNDSTLSFLDTAGTITVNLVGCTGNISYDSAGATIELVVDPVTTSVTVFDTNTPPVAISGARVLLYVTDDNNYFYQRPIISLTSAGLTAAVTHSGHGLSTGDYVIILGAEPDTYNGAFEVTASGADAYTYTIPATAASPASGVPISTFAVIAGLTNASGYISDLRSWSVNQPVFGWVRKSTDPPYYEQAGLVGTIDTVAGLTIVAQLREN